MHDNEYMEYNQQVYVAEADGVPEYNGTITSEKRLVAVKFLSHDASLKER